MNRQEQPLHLQSLHLLDTSHRFTSLHSNKDGLREATRAIGWLLGVAHAVEPQYRT
jgi:hypothetical protein